MPVINVVPNADITTGWDTTVPASPTTHFTKVDEGTAVPDDADYNETTTLTDVDEYALGDTPANTDTVTRIDVRYRARITDTGSTRIIRLELFHTGGATPVTGNPQDVTVANLGGSGVLATVTKSWTGLSLTKAQADSLQLRQTFQ